MRTTLTLDDDVLARARQLADESGRSIGAVISELARSAMTKPAPGSTRNGIRLLPPARDGSSTTLEEVNRLRDETP